MAEFYHHGVKGQKWGVRRYRNKDGTLTYLGKKRQGTTQYAEKGGVIKKGTTLYRTNAVRRNLGEKYSTDTTIQNRKFFSTTKEDDSRWRSEFKPQYDRLGITTTSLKYKTIKDIKVASTTETGKYFLKMQKGMSQKDKQQMKIDTETAKKSYGILAKSFGRPELFDANVATLNVSAQTQTGKKFVEYMLNKTDYRAISDVNGMDVGKDPIIILNPDSQVKLRSAKAAKRQRRTKRNTPMYKKDPMYRKFYPS